MDTDDRTLTRLDLLQSYAECVNEEVGAESVSKMIDFCNGCSAQLKDSGMSMVEASEAAFMLVATTFLCLKTSYEQDGYMLSDGSLEAVVGELSRTRVRKHLSMLDGNVEFLPADKGGLH